MMMTMMIIVILHLVKIDSLDRRAGSLIRSLVVIGVYMSFVCVCLFYLSLCFLLSVCLSVMSYHAMSFVNSYLRSSRRDHGLFSCWEKHRNKK